VDLAHRPHADPLGDAVAPEHHPLLQERRLGGAPAAVVGARHDQYGSPTSSSAKFSKRVYSLMNVSGTDPVGPWRFLPITSSAFPFSADSELNISSRWMKRMTSASCSIAPDSRRSESCGRLSSRFSSPRLSWETAM